MSGVAACTVADGRYHFGAGVLANSLYRNGFRGTFWIGYRGSLPLWAQGKEIVAVGPGMTVRFLPLGGMASLARAKPLVMLRALEADPEATGIVFFDADVVVKGKWSFFEAWIENGAALVIDGCYPMVPSGHPWRREWRRFAEKLGLITWRPLDWYFGSAFLGVRREHIDIVEKWRFLLDTYSDENSESKSALKYGDRCDPFFSLDQDLLNMAAMASDMPLAPVGPEAMDFIPGGYLMSHPSLTEKPWNCRYLRLSLTGHPPTIADKVYWHYADGPIPLFDKVLLLKTRFLLRFAAAIGRFYHGN